jgi:hypothetical protein
VSRTAAASAVSAANRTAAARTRLADKLRAAGWTCTPPKDERPTSTQANDALTDLKPNQTELIALLGWIAGSHPEAVITAVNGIRTHFRRG